MQKTIDQVQLQWVPSATLGDANGGVTQGTNEKTNEGTSEEADAGASAISTELGTIEVKTFRFSRYRVCIKPSNPEAQEIIAERLRRSGGWQSPDSRTPYFRKIFSLHASDEALAAVTPSLMD